MSASQWTVIAAVSLTPSLVAVTAATPSPIPLTIPFPSTVATAALSLAQVIGRPASILPFASRTTADNCTLPGASSATESGVTVSDTTGLVGPGGLSEQPASHPSAPSAA